MPDTIIAYRVMERLRLETEAELAWGNRLMENIYPRYNALGEPYPGRAESIFNSSTRRTLPFEYTAIDGHGQPVEFDHDIPEQEDFFRNNPKFLALDYNPDKDALQAERFYIDVSMIHSIDPGKKTASFDLRIGTSQKMQVYYSIPRDALMAALQQQGIEFDDNGFGVLKNIRKAPPSPTLEPEKPGL